MTGSDIDLTGFRTAAGDAVAGRLTLANSDGSFTTADLTAANFLFAGGVDWQAMVPVNIPIL